MRAIASSAAGALALIALAGCGSSGGGGSVASPSTGAISCLIPSSQLFNGGPGRDGIPALNRPRNVTVAQGDTFLRPDALVLGVVVNGQARAYPHNVLWWHEIVNDDLGGRPLTVSYCPLTGSGLVYDPVIGGRTLNFGVSGLLFDNNLVLFDRATDSLWSQMRIQAVCGSFTGTVPALLPVVQSTWEAWKALHPGTTVVNFETGFARNYNQYPYGRYDQLDDNSLLFPQSVIDTRRPLKELVLGLREGGVARAYPYGALGSRAAVNDVVGGQPRLVVFDRRAQMALPFDREVAGQVLTFEVLEPSAFPFRLRDRETGSLWSLEGVGLEGPLAGNRLRSIATYSAMWFAWASFNRGTELFLPS